MTAEAALLEVKALTCIKGDLTLFENLNFSLFPGEILHIAGENGTGKTSLLKLIAGLGYAESGEIRFKGYTHSEEESNFLESMRYIGHQNGFSLSLSALQNLEFAQSVYGLSNIDIMSLLKEFSLFPQALTSFKYLSRGQKQRLALARLKLGQSSLWILDEPATALDQKGLDLVNRLFYEHAENGGGIIFSSHQDLQMDSVQIKTLNLH